MLRYTLYLLLWNALHVSGGSSALHQELKPVYTASGICQALLSLNWKPVPTLPRQRQAAVKPGKYPMLCIQSWAPDDGRRTRLKHVEHFTEINTLCNVVSCWLYLKIHLGCTDSWMKNLRSDIDRWTKSTVQNWKRHCDRNIVTKLIIGKNCSRIWKFIFYTAIIKCKRKAKEPEKLLRWLTV
jgi:hypothetical protein